MPRFDASTAECLVFTYKEGLLSSIAHDLLLVATELSVDVDLERPAVTVLVDPTSLRVRSALRDGVAAAQLLSDSDRKKIERNIVTNVLDASAFPELSFVSTGMQAIGEGFEISGTLNLHGRSREVRCVTKGGAGRQVAELTLRQPDFGIVPYSALLGTLRIRPEVMVRLTLPWTGPARS